MIEHLENVLCRLLQSGEHENYRLLDPVPHLCERPSDGSNAIRALNAAFLVSLAGPRHPSIERADRIIKEAAATDRSPLAAFYRTGLREIHEELANVCARSVEFAQRLQVLSEWVAHPDNLQRRAETQERVWSVFFPEATKIREQEEHRVETLRRKRRVAIHQLNGCSLKDPAREVLFTSNALLTVPSAARRLEGAKFSDALTRQINEACEEPQRFWYDHPIPIGVAPEANEVLYGLRGLQSALEFERQRGTTSADAKLTCALSVSVTHRGLQGIAREYLAEEIRRAGGFPDLDVYVFTEQDAQKIIELVLVPAAEKYLNAEDAVQQLRMFGVDGPYGRHYSFLKAIAAFWSVLVDPRRKATFKIDLDQVFPQRNLVEETGRSAFEHLMTPLWGARGVDAAGRRVELGMIAGALVNERDIGTSLFTPDVRFPSRSPQRDECVFFSALPQALSTLAEMMTRYETDDLDGRANCIQRIHVTGGTNGILVDSLRRHRPFTPSFIGRAEDQAYILSALFGAGDRLAYAHQPGFIMRHDKEAFAEEAIAAARVGKMIGDYERILYFSEYAGVLDGGVPAVKDVIDPFTGGFVSPIPATLVHLRFALKCAAMFEAGENAQAVEFATLGARRISAAKAFVQGDTSELRKTYEQERRGWELFYDVLDAFETAMAEGDSCAIQLHEQAEKIIRGCRVCC
jgi:hypothetical protein